MSQVTRRKQRATRRRSLDRGQVVAAALKLLDQEGFDGLTMRRLAEVLNIQAPSLYNHIRDKHQLLTLIADEMSGEITPPDPMKPWRQELTALAHSYRKVLKSRRDSARVFAATSPTGHQRLQLIEQVLELLARAGFMDLTTADASFAFNSYIVGFVLDESQALSGERAYADEARRWTDALHETRYPRQTALVSHFTEAQPDRSFEFGLRIILDGLALHLANQHL